MLHIKKNNEPHSLTSHRLTDSANYDNLPMAVKNEIRDSLLSEQGQLCAYCMRRISKEDIQIEHYLAQAVYPDLALDYRNMLGVCPGNKGNRKNQLTCDQHRGETTLTVNPLDADSVSKISYSSDGSIMSEDNNTNIDLNDTLNLNVGLLKNNRKAALDGLYELLKRVKPKGNWGAIANKYIEHYRSLSKKAEYQGILLWTLQKKARLK